MIENKPRRWSIMPKYNPLEWKGYSISPSPMGWRRLFHYLPNILEAPYFAGDKVRFNLSIRQKQKNTSPFYLQIHEFFPEYGSEALQVYDGIVKGEEEIRIVSQDNIAITGDGSYQVIVALKPSSDLDNPSSQIIKVVGHKQIIMTFHAYPSERIFFATFGFILPLIGVAIGWLLKLWLTPT